MQAEGTAGLSFSPAEIRIMGLHALGWPPEQINRWLLQKGEYELLGRPYVMQILPALQSRIGVGDVGLALYYVDMLLPTVALPGMAPGYMYSRWQERAKVHREAMLKVGDRARQQMRAAAMLVANPGYADMTYRELAEFLPCNPQSRRPVSGATVHRCLRMMWDCLGDYAGRRKLAVVCRLAPLDGG